MKQVVQNYRTGELIVDDVPAPPVKPGHILVENSFSLISAGTEKTTVDMAKKNLVDKARARPDLVRKVIDKAMKDGIVDTAKMVMGRLDTRAALGYTCAGIVVDVGDTVSGFARGDRVACAGQNYASHAEVVSIPKNLCVKIPNGVDMEDAAYVAVGSIAMQGVRQAEPKLGEIVAVIGLGLLGQIVVQMLKANGCKVVATDLDPRKLALAKKLGADITVAGGDFVAACESISEGYGVDAVIITASTKSNQPVETAGEVCRVKGKVVVVGAVGMDLPREPFYLKELELRLSMSYGPGRYDSDYEEKGNDYPYGYVRWTEQRNMSAFLDLIAAGKMDIKSLTTHTFLIDDAEQAYKIIHEGSEEYLGILIKYAEENREKFDTHRQIASGKPNSAVVLGMIGVGSHIKDMLLPQLRTNDKVTIKAICTNTGINSKAVATKEGAEYCATDYREILADQSINTILIGTRHDNHAELVIDALKAGKNIFVEKPLCMTAVELETIKSLYTEIVKQTPLVLQVGFNRRHSGHALKIRGVVSKRNNPLTMIYRVNAGIIPADHWIQDMSIGGGRIIGEACHFIDFMQFVASSNPEKIYAVQVGKHNSGITTDKSIITIAFADGSIGTLIYCGDGDKGLAKERFEVFGDGLSIVMDDFRTTDIYRRGKLETFKSKKQDKGFAQEIDQFVSSIAQGDGADELFSQACATTLATFSAMESFKTRQPA